MGGNERIRMSKVGKGGGLQSHHRLLKPLAVENGESSHELLSGGLKIIKLQSTGSELAVLLGSTDLPER